MCGVANDVFLCTSLNFQKISVGSVSKNSVDMTEESLKHELKIKLSNFVIILEQFYCGLHFKTHRSL